SDRSQRDLIDLQNKLASLVKNTQRTFLEFGGLLEKEQQDAGQRILSEGEAALKSDELGELRMSIDALERLGRQLTTAMMKEPAEAYGVLSDPEQRSRYDHFGHAGVSSTAGAAWGAPGFGGIEDILGDLFGFGDVFGGPGRGSTRRSAQQRGADLRYDLEITL